MQFWLIIHCLASVEDVNCNAVACIWKWPWLNSCTNFTKYTQYTPPTIKLTWIFAESLWLLLIVLTEEGAGPLLLLGRIWRGERGLVDRRGGGRLLLGWWSVEESVDFKFGIGWSGRSETVLVLFATGTKWVQRISAGLSPRATALIGSCNSGRLDWTSWL